MIALMSDTIVMTELAESQTKVHRLGLVCGHDGKMDEDSRSRKVKDWHMIDGERQPPIVNDLEVKVLILHNQKSWGRSVTTKG